jgi:hypothetical protein
LYFAITALPRSEYRRLHQAGSDRIFAKPLDPDELIRAIAEVVHCLDGTRRFL